MVVASTDLEVSPVLATGATGWWEEAGVWILMSVLPGQTAAPVVLLVDAETQLAPTHATVTLAINLLVGELVETSTSVPAPVQITVNRTAPTLQARTRATVAVAIC